MCQSLPYAEFRLEDVTNFDVSRIVPDLSIGYTLEVDLEYIRSIYMTDTLTYFSAQHAINRQASAKINF